MSLIPCPECSNPVSPWAPICPSCGCPPLHNAVAIHQIEDEKLPPSLRSNRIVVWEGIGIPDEAFFATRRLTLVFGLTYQTPDGLASMMFAVPQRQTITDEIVESCWEIASDAAFGV